MPTIGVIGGSGPESTIDFQVKLHRAMRDKLHPKKDQDFYRVIVDNNPQTPDRSDALLKGGSSPFSCWAQSIKFLEKSGANILAMPCNTAHVYYDKIQSLTQLPIVNMIRETAESISTDYKGIKQVGILATLAVCKLNLYTNFLQQKSIDIVLPDAKHLLEVHKAIYGIKAGYHSSKTCKQQLSPLELLKEALYNLKEKNIRHVILGCTELPLCIKQIDFRDFIFIDPAEVLAYQCIEILKNKINI